MLMLRAARAMATATRVAGDEEDEGVEEGNDDEELMEAVGW
jgi:hypothetical protein